MAVEDGAESLDGGAGRQRSGIAGAKRFAIDLAGDKVSYNHNMARVTRTTGTSKIDWSNGVR